MRRVPGGADGWLRAGLLVASLGLTGCGAPSAAHPTESAAAPVRLEHDTVILTREAVSRLGITTATVVAVQPEAGAGSAVPAAAVLYDRDGTTWTYATTGPFAYRRVKVTVLRVLDGRAELGSGPGVGTQVVTVGGAELLGAEYGVAGG